MGKISQLIQKSLNLAITAYRLFISPLLGNHCRFHPSCSAYAQTAIKEHGVMRGLFWTIKRILCCHPWHVGGFDPVPEKQQTSKESKK